MPVPPLPLDLVRLIVDELRTSCGCTTTSNENGLAVALVCKDWKDIGLAMAWEVAIISLEDKKEVSLVRLKNSPDRRKHIKRIFLFDTFEEDKMAVRSFAASSKMLALVGEVLEGCEHVTSLIFKALGGGNCKKVVKAVLEAVSSSLERLFFGCADYNDFAATEFIAFLARLSSLRMFETMLLIRNTADEVSSTATLKACLPVRTLDLSVLSFLPSETGPNDFLTGLASTLKPAALRACSINTYGDQIFFIEFLATCPNLTSLIVQPSSADKLAELLPLILPTLHRFPALTSLQFKLGKGELIEEQAELPCPVEPQDFLAALPSSLDAVLLGGLYFEWPSTDELPVVRGRIHPNWMQLSLRTVLCFGAEEEKEPVRSMIMLFLFPGHETPRWYRMACEGTQ